MENNGKRNLIILGVGAILIAGVTTGLSLLVYRNSGDIYLDRSRPGYLPDEKEVENDPGEINSSYTFSDTGELNQKELTEYLKALKKLDDRIKAIADPYAPAPLSDESLGISGVKEPEDAEKTDH